MHKKVMKMAIYKRCVLCGKRILEGSKCECVSKRHKEYDRTRDKRLQGFYGGREWHTLSRYMRTRYQGVDVYELIHNNIHVPGNTVHHIYPVDEYWDMRFDTGYMILLSESNHRKFHSLMKQGKEQEVMSMLIDCVNQYNSCYGYE